MLLGYCSSIGLSALHPHDTDGVLSSPSHFCHLQTGLEQVVEYISRVCCSPAKHLAECQLGLKYVIEAHAYTCLLYSLSYQPELENGYFAKHTLNRHLKLLAKCFSRPTSNVAHHMLLDNMPCDAQVAA